MTKTTRRPVGRPRASNQMSDLPAREDILAASAALFAEHGFKGTSTRMIADSVGIRQPSLFHHFSRKADILEALIDAGEQRIRAYLDRVDFKGDPRVELYQLIVSDCLFLSTEPLGINKLLALPEVRNGALKEKSDAAQAQIVGAYRKLIRAGAKKKYFRVPELESVTQTIFGMSESVWRQDRTKIKNPDKLSRLIADLALRAILLDTDDLERICHTANELSQP